MPVVPSSSSGSPSAGPVCGELCITIDDVKNHQLACNDPNICCDDATIQQELDA